MSAPVHLAPFLRRSEQRRDHRSAIQRRRSIYRLGYLVIKARRHLVLRHKTRIPLLIDELPVTWGSDRIRDSKTGIHQIIVQGLAASISSSVPPPVGTIGRSAAIVIVKTSNHHKITGR